MRPCKITRSKTLVALQKRDPMVSYHPDKLGNHEQCGSGDLMVFVCHTITARD